jgi:hypothetical protein
MAAFLASTTFLSAATVDGIVAGLESDGYQVIEVETSGDKIEVKVSRDGKISELVFDATSGDPIADDSGDDHQGNDDSDDDDGEDDRSEDDRSEDDHSDDDSGDDDSEDDDSEDDD